MDPFFRCAQITRDVLKLALEYYLKRVPTDIATKNRTLYIVDCITAMIAKKPLPKLGGQSVG